MSTAQPNTLGIDWVGRMGLCAQPHPDHIEQIILLSNLWREGVESFYVNLSRLNNAQTDGKIMCLGVFVRVSGEEISISISKRREDPASQYR